jgi:hypothetical protein
MENLIRYVCDICGGFGRIGGEICDNCAGTGSYFDEPIEEPEGCPF